MYKRTRLAFLQASFLLFATKGRNGGVFCRKGYKTPSQPNGKNKDAAGAASLKRRREGCLIS